MRQNSCGLMFIAACCSPHQAPSSGIPNREMYACAAGRTPLLGPEIREPYLANKSQQPQPHHNHAPLNTLPCVLPSLWVARPLYSWRTNPTARYWGEGVYHGCCRGRPLPFVGCAGHWTAHCCAVFAGMCRNERVYVMCVGCVDMPSVPFPPLVKRDAREGRL